MAEFTTTSAIKSDHIMRLHGIARKLGVSKRQCVNLIELAIRQLEAIDDQELLTMLGEFPSLGRPKKTKTT